MHTRNNKTTMVRLSKSLFLCATSATTAAAATAAATFATKTSLFPLRVFFSNTRVHSNQVRAFGSRWGGKSRCWGWSNNYSYPCGASNEGSFRHFLTRKYGGQREKNHLLQMERGLSDTSQRRRLGQSIPTTPITRYLIYWRGEHKEEYSESFRQWEFLSALSATIADANPGQNASAIFQTLNSSFTFTNVFCFDPYKCGDEEFASRVPAHQIQMYNEALQYFSVEDGTLISSEIVAKTTERCSMVHSAYLPVSDGFEYSTVSEKAMESDALEDLMSKQLETDGKSWCFRRHEYGFANDDIEAGRFGKRNTRSVKKERQALMQLESLFLKFGGKVDLKNPECKVYLLEGVRENNSTNGHNIKGTESTDKSLWKVLARRIASGAKTSILAPKTRICVTNTPLCPIAAYLLCNIAMTRENQTILDPFAGSGATLLAASMIAPSARTVGIEIATDQFLPRSKIREDFVSRDLNEPVALLEGDAMDSTMRDKACNAIGGEGFDVIITDPPYGIREAMSGSNLGFDGSAALLDLIDVIGHDRRQGTRLLKEGGRLVSFFPCTREYNINDLLPRKEQLDRAGLTLEDKREQRLNSGLSRWVLLFSCH